jgi:NodT family efflux transporter outer membrane factor (OMF) lipoprotein
MSPSRRSPSRNLQAALTTLAAAVLFLGCKVGPDYVPPKVDAGRGWTTPGEAGPARLEAWWQALGDPTMDRLEAAAMERNLDLRQAEVRIRQARALRDQAAARQAPVLKASAGVSREEQTLNGRIPVGRIPGMTRDLTLHDVGFDASWELDLFGGTRRKVESAEASAQATLEQARDARVSVAAEVARTYLTLRGAQRELAARGKVVEALRRTLESQQRRLRAGDLAEVEVERARGQLLDAEALLPGLRAQAQGAALGLGVLLGGLPESEAGLLDTAPGEPTLAAVPVGERADILRRRPDIRIAERQLAAATADIGAARAEWFPNLNIAASGGYEAQQLGDLFKSASQVARIAPLISWRILDGGAIKAEIRAAEARQQVAALGYEKAVLAALADAERALSGYRLALEALRGRQEVLDSARRGYGHQERRFQAGDIALADLLAADRTVREAEDALARAQTSAAIDLVALCKALGGGWETRKS